jgi:hypothetical protein
MIVTNEMAEAAIDILLKRGWLSRESGRTKTRVDMAAAMQFAFDYGNQAASDEAPAPKAPKKVTAVAVTLCRNCKREIIRRALAAPGSPDWVHAGGLLSCNFVATPE